MEKLHDSAEWKAALEKNEWTDFFKTGDDFDDFLEDREHPGEGRPPGHRADRVRQSWTGPRLAGAFLLAASVAILHRGHGDLRARRLLDERPALRAADRRDAG